VTLRADTIEDLRAHARELAARAAAEGDPAPARRALVVLAVAGTGGDRAGYEADARAAVQAFAALGTDPIPVFDAASALAEDPVAREVLVTLPRAAAQEVRDQLVARLGRR
jgi:hypothetical protein